MHLRSRLALAAIAALAVSACSDEVTTPTPAARAPDEAALSAAAQADPAMQMRAGLRGRPDDAFLAEVREGGDIVTVGFRPEGSERGVSARGASLVPRAAALQHRAYVERLAQEVIFRFDAIPAITVRLKDPADALRLRKLPWVDYVAPNTRLLTPDQAEGTLSPSDAGCAPLSSPQTLGWNVTRIRADQVWAQHGVRGSLGELYMLDDAIDVDGSLTEFTPNNNGSSVGVSGVPYNQYTGSHGTLVLSVAVARDNGVGMIGVAPSATYNYANVSTQGATTGWETASAWAINANPAGTKVITMSLSTKITSSSPPSSFTALLDAIRNAYYQRGQIIVASTGNQEASNLYAYPARWSEVVGVGGSNFSDGWVHNNYAPGNVEVAAPSVSVPVVCKNGDMVGTNSGTSFATPAVAAAFMLLHEKHPYESNAQLRARLRNTAVPMGNTQKSGSGRIDVLAAINYVHPPVVDLVGPGYITQAGYYTWDAMASGGNGSYTYQWYWTNDNVNWTPMGNGSSLSMYINYNDYFTLRVDVTSNGVTGTDSHPVLVEWINNCDPYYYC
ncbi:MAG TPA: S8 family serine peptidase [Longimicrobium sp.]|nr:S8 family serine peptidase [Longimicrobium sp.]